ncbi:MAG TPA: alpha-glucan family phosphorylase, partial [Cytophagaceae bacterium]
DQDGMMKPYFIRKNYSFLKDTGIIFPVAIHNTRVLVKAYYLHPETFGTAPIFLLTTDIPENDYLSRTITHKLYDSNEPARIAQSIILGIGGATLIDIMGLGVDVYHMNEGHALPLVYYLYSKFRNKEEVKKRVVFTTHTPEKAGNEEHSLKLLEEMSFFHGLSLDQVREISGITKEDKSLNYTLTALRFAKISNAVSKIHRETSREMWKDNHSISDIISITNAQNKKYWVDCKLENAFKNNDDAKLLKRKRQLKKELFQVVADQTGKLLDPDVLTIVWARRFAGYKRADLITRNYDRFLDLVTSINEPVQVIWAGKPYPEDHGSIELFNHLIKLTEHLPRCAVLTGYELKLSALLKRGSDVWLNNPRYPREASGTSGMTAAMNGSINVSIADGWMPEFAKNGENCFMAPSTDLSLSYEEQDRQDAQNILNILEEKVIPTYYRDKKRWVEIMKNAMRDVVPEFNSDRMAIEYYEKMYC